MMDYSPPLRDIQFVMHELLNASNVFSEMPDFPDVDASLIDQIAEEIGRFAVDVLAPLNKVGDQSGCRLEQGAVKTPPGFQRRTSPIAMLDGLVSHATPNMADRVFPKHSLR